MESYVEIRMVFEVEVEGRHGRGRPARRWIDLVKDDMKVRGVTSALVGDRGRWRAAIDGLMDRVTPASRENARDTICCCCCLYKRILNFYIATLLCSRIF